MNHASEPYRTPQENTLTAHNPRIPSLMQEAQTSGMLQSPQVSKGLLLGPGKHTLPDGSTRFDLSIIDLDSDAPNFALIPMPFFGHGVSPNPTRPERAAIFEKWGSGACEVDLLTGELVRMIETTPDRQFYGHGAYSPDGKVLYCTETIVAGDYSGVIAMRDAETLDYLGEFPSYGLSPHDCHLIDEGRTMVVTNGGGPLDGSAPCVTYIDVASQQLKEKLTFDTPNINAGHIAIADNGGIAVVSAPRQKLDLETSNGGVSLKPHAGELATMTEPEQVVSRLKGETLSTCIDNQRNIVAATTPMADTLTFWDLDTGKLLQHYHIANPRGITLTADRKYYVVTYGSPVAQLSLIDVSTLEKVQGFDLEWTGMTGSHVYSYSLPANLRRQ